MLLYAICILYITILSRTPALAHTVRPIPFWSFLDWFKGNWSRGGSIALNIILFVPFGYLLAGIWRKKRVSILICLGFSVLIEVIQFITYRGFFDVDDVIANTLGGVIGALCYWKFDAHLKRWHVQPVLIIAGIIGCLITTRNTVVYETQFGFDIDSVAVENGTITLTGDCSVYRREGLKYYIQLKGDKAYRAETNINGEHFTAVVEAGTDLYEIDVVFSGYQPINTGVYIKDGKIEYVIDTPGPEVIGTDLESVIDGGTLMVYNSEYDTYIYQIQDQFYWIIGADFDASIIYHLYTDEPDNLPEDRLQYGFDNRGFRIGSEKELTETMNCGKYRVFSDIIPDDYHVTAIAVGMNKGPDIFWREYFRPVR